MADREHPNNVGDPDNNGNPDDSTALGILIARKLQIHGHVQGVYYRDSCRREAEARGVRGYALNCADESVEVYLEGVFDAVEALIAWCRRGPTQARVDVVDITESDLHHPTGFLVG